MLAVIVVALAVGLFTLRGGKAVAPAAVSLPRVTYIVPGRQAVAGQISTTGSLAARREMPVGVAGEGGMISRVLVEPGDWVAAGQVLATIDQSVQAQEGASLAAGITVARADAAIAQSELDRAKALVARGFISKADIDRKTATRDAANARVQVAQAQYGESGARIGRLAIRAPAAGLVLTRAVEPGQVVSSASGTLFRMAKGGETGAGGAAGRAGSHPPAGRLSGRRDAGRHHHAVSWRDLAAVADHRSADPAGRGAHRPEV